MDPLILTLLSEIETSEQVRIVYACESGSRAWGFPSVDSDYDVRFIYLRPTPAYLSVEDRRDVIEEPIEQGLDINGWDIRKALQLLGKSNPPLLEWLGSPIVYLEKYNVAERMRALARKHFSPRVCFYHYLHMARHGQDALAGGGPLSLKKYCYSLRPLLALEWIDRGLGIAPTDFRVLVESILDDPGLKSDILQLLTVKRNGTEHTAVPPIASIDEFIDKTLIRWREVGAAPNASAMPSDLLDQAFRDSLDEVWRS
jgi:predicted nucleotidyltransferase